MSECQLPIVYRTHATATTDLINMQKNVFSLAVQQTTARHTCFSSNSIKYAKEYTYIFIWLFVSGESVFGGYHPSVGCPKNANLSKRSRTFVNSIQLISHLAYVTRTPNGTYAKRQLCEFPMFFKLTHMLHIYG